jgi:ubiquinone/menaquinone biosynthesis C-methylase UbiE
MEFFFPIPPGYHEKPIWDGGGFQIGSERVQVLKYTQCDAGWDASLTDFHEKEVEAGNYYIDRASRLHAILELEKNISNIKNHDAILLEIGSSSGYLLSDVKSSFPGAFLIGSDCISEPLENIAKRMPNIPVIQFDLVECPLPDNCVDVIIALNVLEHIRDDEVALNQIYRILKPGGYAIIEVPANQDLYDFFDEQLKHFRRYNLKELCDIARKSKFKIIHGSHFGFFIYPAFKFVKLRNQRSADKKISYTKKSVKELIHMGGPFNDYVLYWIMLFEIYLGKLIRYPTGIRCVLTIQKPLDQNTS